MVILCFFFLCGGGGGNVMTPGSIMWRKFGESLVQRFLDREISTVKARMVGRTEH